MVAYLNSNIQQMLNSYKPINGTDESAIIIRAKKGDNIAQNQLINAQIPQVVKIAKAYACNDIPAEDLVQEGCIGILTAVEKFDLNMGKRFSTYSIYWIREAITSYVRNNMGIVRLPVNKQKVQKRVNQVSFDAPLSDDAGNTMYDTISGEYQNSSEVYTNSEYNDIMEKMQNLNPMDADAVRLYFIEKYDYRAIAAILSKKYKSITCEWVRQRINKMLAEMREHCQFQSLSELISAQP